MNPAQTGRPRKPWVAGFLSVLQPGLGHLYAGRLKLAVTIWLGVHVLGTAFALFLSLSQAGSILPLGPVAAIGLVAVAASDSVRCARRANPGIVPRRYNRWYVYAGLLVIELLLVQPPLIGLLSTRIRALRLVSPSMEPGLLPGDFLVASRLNRPPARLDVVIIHARGLDYVKRVVGLPGDTLSMRGGTLYVNGRARLESYAQRTTNDEITSADFQWQRDFLVERSAAASYRPTQATWGPLLVPTGDYFVLGDNRDESLDSRQTGFTPGDSIRGHAIVLYMSIDPATKLPRLSRIGKRIQ